MVQQPRVAGSARDLVRAPGARVLDAKAVAASATQQLEASINNELGIDTVFVLEGLSAAAGQTSLPLGFGGGQPFALGEPGMPVLVGMRTGAYRPQVACSWVSDNVPAGDWTLTLWRRPSGGTFSAVATFSALTS